jgi:hypothetical protein
MKKAFVIAVASLMIAGVSSWAQSTVAFPVKFKGLVSYPVTSNAAAKLAVSEVNLMSSAANHLVVVVADPAYHQLYLIEVTSSNTPVAILMQNHRLAMLPDGNFAAGMEFNFTLPAISGGLGVNGDVVFFGKLTYSKGQPKNLVASVDGVLNDSVDGNPYNGDITVKGKITPAGTPFDGSGLIPR